MEELSIIQADVSRAVGPHLELLAGLKCRTSGKAELLLQIKPNANTLQPKRERVSRVALLFILSLNIYFPVQLYTRWIPAIWGFSVYTSSR